MSLGRARLHGKISVLSGSIVPVDREQQINIIYKGRVIRRGRGSYLSGGGPLGAPTVNPPPRLHSTSHPSPQITLSLSCRIALFKSMYLTATQSRHIRFTVVRRQRKETCSYGLSVPLYMKRLCCTVHAPAPNATVTPFDQIWMPYILTT